VSCQKGKRIHACKYGNGYSLRIYDTTRKYTSDNHEKVLSKKVFHFCNCIKKHLCSRVYHLPDASRKEIDSY
jgi:hypothetical protein